MRYMMIVRATADSEAGIAPDPSVFEAMAGFNEALIEAGVLLAADGLHPSSKGARVSKTGGKIVVKDGPFAEAKELIAGFWLIQVKSREDALGWARRVPLDEGEYIDVMQVFEASDFADVISEEQVARFEGQRGSVE